MSSKAEKVLLAAFKMWPDQVFTAEDLVVAAWTQFPEDFGLQGYEPTHPDANVVYRYLMGQSSIVKKHHWLDQVGSKLYRLSVQGVQQSLDILEAGEATDFEKGELKLRITRSRELVLSRMLKARAWNKFLNGDDIVFREAAAFWGINARSSGQQYINAKKETEEALRLAKERLSASSHGLIKIPTINAEIGLGEIGKLEKLEEHLVDRFSEELEAIAGRRVDRGRLKE